MYIIKNGLIIDPQSGFNQVSDMLIDQEKLNKYRKKLILKAFQSLMQAIKL